MPEKKTLNEDLFYKGSSANLPRLHTCKNKVPFWDFKEFAVTISRVSWSQRRHVVCQAVDELVGQTTPVRFESAAETVQLGRGNEEMKSVFVHLLFHELNPIYQVMWHMFFILHGGTIKLSSKRKQHYSFILKLLLKQSTRVTWLFSRADIYSM